MGGGGGGPLSDAAMGPGHRRLDVDGVVPQPPQLQGLVQRAHHKQSVMEVWEEGTTSKSQMHVNYER